MASEAGTYVWKMGTFGTPEAVIREELGPRLADYARTVSNPRVVVRGDRSAPLGAAVRALDEVRKAGITQVVVETRPGAMGG
jgi:biopolymer transport protein ExbD